MDRDSDILAVANQSFINRIVDHFIYKVMQSFFADVSNVHRWAPANRF